MPLTILEFEVELPRVVVPPPPPHEARPDTANSIAKIILGRALEPAALLFDMILPLSIEISIGNSIRAAMAAKLHSSQLGRLNFISIRIGVSLADWS